MFVCLNLCLCVCMFLCMFVRMSVCMFVFMFVCMYVNVCGWQQDKKRVPERVRGPSVSPWSSLVEGDEQMDRPISRTCIECCHVCPTFGGCHKHNILPLGPIKPAYPCTKELHG